MKHFLHIGYDGTKYRGWQRQPNAKSVQETIESTLQKIFHKAITVYGCGRTDAGVHASQYFIHITLPDDLDFDLKFRLNKNLPDDIAVYELIPIKENHHCRYDATSRSYTYYIHTENDPVLSRYSSYYDLQGYDFTAMQAATKLLTKYNDFRAICKHPDFYKHTLCEVTEAQLKINSDKTRLQFTITANRFLRGMVRLCIYYLLEIGKGHMTLTEFEHVLANKISKRGLKPALPNGLHLSKINYPYLDIPLKHTSICALLQQEFIV